MYSSIVFFDNVHESWKGTKRGFVAFIFIIFFWYLWYKIIMKNFYKPKKHFNTYLLMSSLLLCSAIAVQLPKTGYEAVVYGGLLGLVVYGFSNFTSKNTSNTKVLVDTVYGMVSTSMVSYLVFVTN